NLKPRYITTTLPYVNMDPHIGFALEIIHADVLARYWRLIGHDVFFTTGTDEHGQKIAEKAKENDQDTQQYVDHYANEFQNLKDVLNLSYDNFIRTTSGQHKHAAQELWRRCAAAGDIYKKSYKGLYCVGDEMFLKESDLVDGKCPNHPTLELIEIEEENYFFALSKYQEHIRAYLNDPSVIMPEWRREEAIRFVEGGLEDFSISREKARMSWGIPVPDDEEQVMYVWFDALTNYISTLGWPEDGVGTFKKFWEEGSTLQLAGKDQVRFQSIMWQGMLLSAGIKPTDTVMYHGFITSGGQKMSKSLGNVISPFELVNRYGTDATRYLLLRHVHPYGDTDITHERLDDWYTANLANGLGNLTARIMKMAENNLEEKVEDFSLYDGDTSLESFSLQMGMENIWSRIGELDEFIAEKEPFKVVKTDPTEGKKMISDLVRDLYHIALRLQPYMPDTAEKIMAAIKENKKPETLFARID
ncbi:MAG: methionine--tRNA ligase, partial [Candidatus Paceibacterota bacterium]